LKTRIVDSEKPDDYTAETAYLSDLVGGGESPRINRRRLTEQQMKARIWGWVAVVVCFALFLPSAQAQYRAGLQGTVLDSQGAVVSGAKVTLLNLETNHSDTATTGSSGVYNFSSLPPGHYSVTVERQGFTKKVLADVEIAA
jgi:carboxypeptidase family protein